MTTIDEIGRRAAASARADAAAVAAARVEADLARLRRAERPASMRRPRRHVDGRRLFVLGTAAALTAAAVIAIVINATGSSPRRLVPTETTPATSTAVTPTSATAAPSTVTTDVVATTAPAVVVDANAIAVSAADPPPRFPAERFATVDAAAQPTIAVGDTWIVAVDGTEATLIDRFSQSEPQHVSLPAAPTGSIAAGPGDVLYAVVQGAGTEMSLDAIALTGDRAGQVVASAAVGAAAFAEAPAGALGHGPDGIVDRRTGDTLMGYVDSSGAPTSLGRAAHALAVISGDVASGDLVVRDPDGHHDWHLTIDRDPAFAGETDSLPAPSSHGGAVVSTSLQAAGESLVVAVLAADGTGTWYSLADGWQFATSDLDGTILIRANNGTFELARLDPPQRIDFLDQPAAPHQRVAFAETLPSTSSSADPCTADQLALVPTTDGAAGTVYGVLNVRNSSTTACSVTGVPDVALLSDAGDIVQSTDPTLFAGPSATAIVLEPDSWARAELGPIASNVCGGSESSQLKLTIGSKSTVVPFAVGGPSQPDQCSPAPSEPGPGAMAVQPFAPIDANPDANTLPPDLHFALDAPASVRAGEVLRYDVVLTTDSDASFLDGASCPIYQEELGAASAQFILDCHGNEGITIQRGEEVRFHVELPIPAGTTPGAATLTWTPLEPSGTPITANLTITP